jgi:hypothetical protein
LEHRGSAQALSGLTRVFRYAGGAFYYAISKAADRCGTHHYRIEDSLQPDGCVADYEQDFAQSGQSARIRNAGQDVNAYLGG